MIAINLRKQEALDTSPIAIQRVNFSVNFDRAGKESMYFIAEEAKKILLDFSQGTTKIFWIYFALIQYEHKITSYNTLNVKLSNSLLHKLKSEEKMELQ